MARLNFLEYGRYLRMDFENRINSKRKNAAEGQIWISNMWRNATLYLQFGALCTPLPPLY